YDACNARERNRGLFTADQRLRGGSAVYTRQNPAGTRRGYECPEERDYYPYWHPTPWLDVAVLTDNLAECPALVAASAAPTHACVRTFAADSGRRLWAVPENNEFDCAKNGGRFVAFYPYLETTRPPAQPAATAGPCRIGTAFRACSRPVWCRRRPWTAAWLRQPATTTWETSWAAAPVAYDWQLPNFPSGDAQRCVLRLRYNLTSSDSEQLIRQNPLVQPGLQLAVNSNQVGRVFQDRSHVFQLHRVPVPVASNLHHVGVRGKRGNIVQVYPAVEYDFTPTRLSARVGDHLFLQWSGSNSHNNGAPAGDGQAGDDGAGAGGTDRSNLAEAGHANDNLPLPWEASGFLNDGAGRAVWAWHGQLDGLAPRDFGLALASAGYYRCFAKAACGADSEEAKTPLDPELNAAPASFPGLLIRLDRAGQFKFICTRNNNFSNRSHKWLLTHRARPERRVIVEAARVLRSGRRSQPGAEGGRGSRRAPKAAGATRRQGREAGAEGSRAQNTCSRGAAVDSQLPPMSCSVAVVGPTRGPKGETPGATGGGLTEPICAAGYCRGCWAAVLLSAKLNRAASAYSASRAASVTCLASCSRSVSIASSISRWFGGAECVRSTGRLGCSAGGSSDCGEGAAPTPANELCFILLLLLLLLVPLARVRQRQRQALHLTCAGGRRCSRFLWRELRPLRRRWPGRGRCHDGHRAGSSCSSGGSGASEAGSGPASHGGQLRLPGGAKRLLTLAEARRVSSNWEQTRCRQATSKSGRSDSGSTGAAMAPRRSASRERIWQPLSAPCPASADARTWSQACSSSWRSRSRRKLSRILFLAPFVTRRASSQSSLTRSMSELFSQAGTSRIPARQLEMLQALDASSDEASAVATAAVAVGIPIGERGLCSALANPLLQLGDRRAQLLLASASTRRQQAELLVRLRWRMRAKGLCEPGPLRSGERRVQ
uniref:Kringle domain-containing protein n=1 Tax=Macrostomum lignano TaxID=282301 RepID=A0A1I8FUY3_9PLAT